MQGRRVVLRTMAAVPFAIALEARSQAPAYPVKPVTIIVPFAPGGNVDVTARVVSTAMARDLKTTFVVDNRPGAGGLIGQELGKRARPDGYTLVAMANGSFAVAPRLAPHRTFTLDDFAPVGMMATTPMVIAVPAASPHKTFAQFAAFARANPEKLSIGHPGNGTTNHVAVLRMQQILGARLTIVPYKGSAPGLTDVLGGQIDGFVDQLPSTLPYVLDGRLRALAVTSAQRAPELKDVPTLDELGLTGFDVVTSTGLIAPAGTPPEIVSVLNRALNKALESAEVQRQLAPLGATARPLTPEDFGAYLAREDANAEALVKDGLLKAE